MKGLKLLIMSLFAVLFLAGCETNVAGNECKSNADCETTEACYAGYCSSKELPPTGGMFIKLQFVNKSSLQEDLTCKFTGIETVELTFDRGTFTLPARDTENGYTDETGAIISNFEYKYVVPCEKLSLKDLNGERGFYVGEKSSIYDEEGEGKGPFQQTMGYVMTANFKDAEGNVIRTPQRFDVKATELALLSVNTSQPTIDTTVQVDKVATADLNIVWTVNNSGDVYNDPSACDTLHIDKFYLKKDGVADTDNTYEDFEEIDCENIWKYTEKITAIVNTSFYIYAVDTYKEKLFSYEKSLSMTQEQFDSGTINKTFQLDSHNGNKK